VTGRTLADADALEQRCAFLESLARHLDARAYP